MGGWNSTASRSSTWCVCRPSGCCVPGYLYIYYININSGRRWGCGAHATARAAGWHSRIRFSSRSHCYICRRKNRHARYYIASRESISCVCLFIKILRIFVSKIAGAHQLNIPCDTRWSLIEFIKWKKKKKIVFFALLYIYPSESQPTLPDGGYRVLIYSRLQHTSQILARVATSWATRAHMPF